jgi:histidinol-phosphate aminotransferase
MIDAPDIQPVRSLRGRARYRRSSSPRPIDLHLDANEGGAFGAEVLSGFKIDIDSLRRYPDARELESTFAARLSVSPDRVLVTAGADDALQRICSAMLEPGRRAVYCMPSFEMLRRYVRFTGAEPIEIPWPAGPLPTDALIEACRGGSADVLFVVSPNNPTGTVATRDDLVRLRKSLPDTLIALDAAYGEFADDDLTSLALSMPWTVVTRTLSKAWSAAGLRVGYAAGDARAIDWLRAVGQPYAVSGVSLALAKALLDRAEPLEQELVARVRDERMALTQLLRELGADPVQGQANFVLAHFQDAALVADLLEGLGIAVRRFPSEIGLANALRIGCPGDSNAFVRLRRALRAALQPQAIMLDLNDGTARAISSGALCLLRSRYTIGAVQASVGSALRELDVESAWMLSGSSDRLASARSAGVVPVGLIAAGRSGECAESALLAAGAARVLTRPEQLLEILP